MAAPTLYTVGHSNQSFEELLAMLQAQHEHCHRRLLAEHLQLQSPDNVKIVHLV